MDILGLGFDATDIPRVADVYERYGDRFLRRVFTEGEIAYCTRRRNPVPHLAGRFAAKEAVLKVLGTGWRGGIAWTDVEVIRESSGQPKITLTGECQRIAKDLGISTWHVSISHIETHATASAIGLRGE